MGGMKFEYDEEGGTFYYFLLSFVALVLFPATYYLWPGKSSKDEQKKNRVCYCEPCKIKRQCCESNQPRKKIQQYAIKTVLIIGWIFFAFIAYKTSQVELDFKEFDPYAELGIDRGAEVGEIKKAYRKLSLIYHPDRETGDSHKFMKITKAHDALTDEEARKNWEEYGNPDGPGATQVGIALPKWIVEKQNSIWVLGLYALIFMIILPVCVGIWWYKSIKYSAQQVLIDTTRMYYSFLRKSSNMILKRVIMVLSGSYEFSKHFNSEIIERPSDNTEIPELIRDLPQFIQNTRELPFYVPYCVKARALLIAHFSGKQLSSKSLEYDKEYILKKCPYLLSEMLSLAQQLYFIAQAEKNPYKLSLDTVDNIMKVSQMVIQGLWCHKSPLLQLPHITEDMLRHFVTKRRSIRSIKELASMSDEDRRALMRHLNDRDYKDVLTVLSMIPYNVDVSVTCEVKGEEDKTVTAGSFVTVTVKLNRNSSAVVANQQANFDGYDDGFAEQEEENEEEDDDSQQQQLEASNQVQAKNKWLKIKKKKGGNKKSKNKKISNKVVVLKKAVEEEKETPPASNNVTPKTTKSSENKKNDSSKHENDANDGASTGDESDGNNSSDETRAETEAYDGGVSNKGDEDDEEWVAFQKESRKDNLLETKSKETHLVHCPHYPGEKYEWWWLYMADLKKKQLISGPIQVTTLRDYEEKELRFNAPPKAGTYHYAIVLRSDSYLGVDQTINVKVDVKEAKKMIEPEAGSSDEEGNAKKEFDSDSEISSATDDESDD